MGKSKYLRLLGPFLKKPFFKASEARLAGIPSRMLSHFCENGIIERIARGMYRGSKLTTNIPIEFEELVLTTLSIPSGVICLISALCYYELTDQIMREYWIAIPNSDKKTHRPALRIIRMRNMTLGLTSVKIGNYKVRIFDRERTIIDAFRFLSHEIAIKVLRNYLKSSGGKKPNLVKLSRYAKALRINIDAYVLALTT